MILLARAGNIINVVKKNPLAVGIRDGYLTVDYSKIDVNMELV